MNQYAHRFVDECALVAASLRYRIGQLVVVAFGIDDAELKVRLAEALEERRRDHRLAGARRSGHQKIARLPLEEYVSAIERPPDGEVASSELAVQLPEIGIDQA